VENHFLIQIGIFLLLFLKRNHKSNCKINKKEEIKIDELL